MTPDSVQPARVTNAQAPETVLCRRCGAPNPAGQDRCSSCRQAYLPGNSLAFKRGNTAGLKIGLRGRALTEATEALLPDVEAALGTIGAEPRFRHNRMLLAGALARYQLISEWLSVNGIHDGKGRLRKDELHALEQAHGAAARAATALGMTPASAAALGVDIGKVRTMTLAEQLAAERRARQEQA